MYSCEFQNLSFTWRFHCQPNKSVDTTEGTGDHENFFKGEETTLDVVFKDGTYSCTKKAIRIRTVGSTDKGHQTYPFSNIDKTILFSKLTDEGLKFYKTNSVEKLESSNNKKVKYQSAVKAEYG